jgi:long-chain acyl-CoA synthetase
MGVNKMIVHRPFFVTSVVFVVMSLVSSFTTSPSIRWSVLSRRAAATIDEQAVAAAKQRGLSTEEEAILFGEESTDGSTSTNPPFPDHHRVKDKFGNILPDRTVGLNPLDHASDPLINKLHTMRGVVQSCPEIWLQLESICPDLRALLDEHLCDTKVDLTFAEMSQMVQKSASIFASLGVKRGINVAILGENSAYWLIVDHGIQLAGGASAVRGADAPLDELRYIYEHSDSAGVAVVQGPKLLRKLAADAASKKIGKNSLGLWNEKHGDIKHVILMHREKQSDEALQLLGQELGIEVSLFSSLLDSASPLPKSEQPQLTRDDLATIVYTSGTTGRPKGVMLTHGNLLHQTGHRLAPTLPYEESEPLPGESMVSLLPVWHITERSFELWMASRGCNVVYSSIRTFKNDLAKYQPEWMVLVPRVLEKIALGVQEKFSSGSVAVRALSKLFTATGQTASAHRKIASGLVVADEAPDGLQRLVSKLYVGLLTPINALGNKLVWSKVQAGFGGKLKVIISGGSALAGSLEQFYETAGFTVCVGYGLTECSPLISYRRSDTNLATAGCAGKPCLDTELRIVDPESKQVPRPSLPDGQVGVVIARGPQVMRGYYKNPEATASITDSAGWFDTGDLGRINPATGDLILTGRAKDTIVLSNGENVEPTPIEDAILGECTLIEQVMLTGQDGRRLVAITVLNPNALAEAGFLDRARADELQQANEKVNDPKCTEDDCERYGQILREASATLRGNSELRAALAADASRATAQFRKWEQVGDIYFTLEPFAMANGLLTQSYKVKRDAVLKRYESSLPK